MQGSKKQRLRGTFLTGGREGSRAFGVGLTRGFFCQFTTKNIFVVKKWMKNPSSLAECSWSVVMA
jgi:hypothetical protein